MKITTGKEMGEIDRYTIEELGIPGAVLMEKAGLKIAEVVQEKINHISNPQVVILAGRGNNGGDGFVVARLLKQAGIKVNVFLLGEQKDIGGDARINLEILNNLEIPVQELTTEEEVKAVTSTLQSANLVVDALLGTGITGKLRGLFPILIKLINSVETDVLAVDIPSGVEADTGQVRANAIKAETTVAFALPKRGNILYPGAEHCGELRIVDIGIPEAAVEAQNLEVSLITKEEVRNLVPERKANSHKGNYGKLLIIAGSPGMTGAATLTAQASLKAGAGLVTVGTPASLNSILETKLTEAMTYPLPDKKGVFNLSALQEIEKLAEDRDLLAVGPGLGQEIGTFELISGVLEIEKPLVLDADGLNALEDLGQLSRRQAGTILTPHPGELARLIDKSIAEIQADRIGTARQFAVQYGVYLVLKGARTVIAAPGGEVFINATGNSGLATGGSGDVLTGLIAGKLAQGLEPLAAVKLAVYMHGKAAELGAKELTEYSFLPSDLLNYLPEAIKLLQ